MKYIYLTYLLLLYAVVYVYSDENVKELDEVVEARSADDNNARESRQYGGYDGRRRNLNRMNNNPQYDGLTRNKQQYYYISTTNIPREIVDDTDLDAPMPSIRIAEEPIESALIENRNDVDDENDDILPEGRYLSKNKQQNRRLRKRLRKLRRQRRRQLRLQKNRFTKSKRKQAIRYRLQNKRRRIPERRRRVRDQKQKLSDKRREKRRRNRLRTKYEADQQRVQRRLRRQRRAEKKRLIRLKRKQKRYNKRLQSNYNRIISGSNSHSNNYQRQPHSSHSNNYQRLPGIEVY